MCTLSVISAGDVLRLAMNRDELHSRPAAFPPRAARFGGRTAIFPVDPRSGGTWIAVNDAGLAFAVLNVNASPSRTDGDGPSPLPVRRERSGEGSARLTREVDRSVLAPSPGLPGEGEIADASQNRSRHPGGAPHEDRRASAHPTLRSRGEIIPRLLHCDDLPEAWAAAEAIDVREFPPFRLVIADANQLVTLAPGDAEHYDAGEFPLMFTSSGLGDHLVQPPRRALFENLAPATPAAQDAFHRHAWPDRPELSVCMSRSDAATVSYTVIEIGRRRVSLKYLDRAPAPQPTEQHRYEPFNFHSCAVPLDVAAGAR